LLLKKDCAAWSEKVRWVLIRNQRLREQRKILWLYIHICELQIVLFVF
jgi:hypothetical protein